MYILIVIINNVIVLSFRYGFPYFTIYMCMESAAKHAGN